MNWVKNRVRNKISMLKWYMYLHSPQPNYNRTKSENYKRVLHIWDTAGVASLLSRELNKNGYQSDVIMRSTNDTFGITKYYGNDLNLGAAQFLFYCKKRAINYGIIHIHGIPNLVPEYKKLFPRKKIVLQFHGSDLASPSSIDDLVKNSKHADAIVCSTPDLEPYILAHPSLPKPYICLNAVDTTMFKPMPNVGKITEKALYIKGKSLDFNYVVSYLKNTCPWEYEIIDRETIGVPFFKMPELYNRYYKLIDLKIYNYSRSHGVPVQAWSKTGLEALA